MDLVLSMMSFLVYKNLDAMARATVINTVQT